MMLVKLNYTSYCAPDYPGDIVLLVLLILCTLKLPSPQNMNTFLHTAGSLMVQLCLAANGILPQIVHTATSLASFGTICENTAHSEEERLLLMEY